MRIIQTATASDTTAMRGCTVVLTMGSLHSGHASLVARAREHAGPGGTVVVTVFVNPTQFNETTDFDSYPRDLAKDAELCAGLGADLVYAPPVSDVYPDGQEIPVGDLPAVATEPGLEEAYRPGHFPGVCQVVRRFFELTGATASVFGTKDWQQLQVVRAMVDAEDLGVEIVPGMTVREHDGLAMSSRNLLLDPESRRRAAAISQAIRHAGTLESPTDAETEMTEIIRAAGLTLEYAAVRDAATLRAPRGQPCRALVAARIGGVRLIDNGPWPAAGPDNPL